MTGYVISAQGETTVLPAPLSWVFQYTSGVPCDSFQIRCLWEGTNTVDPQQWCTFRAMEEDQVVFTGVIDECETALTSQGAWIDVSGRGMAARLLDNEALGQDYQVATLDDILRDHVTPYGITVAQRADMAPVSQFSVAVGSSEWSVLYDFVRYYHSIPPRFDREGRLVLTPWEDNTTLRLDDATPVKQLVRRDRHYGVLSQVVVRDRYQQLTQTVNNEDFQAMGGSRRQVLTMPGKSQFQAMRYSGQFQLDQSAVQQLVLEVTIPILFYGKPGDLVQLSRSDWGRSGLYRVEQAQVGVDESGGWTRLELVPPDVLV